ncbi:hypothetical protein [Thiobacter aerophilum]|uniref:Uncharacterized protein n=1 Tax=Thiobacter aerophilum TaxID=3121275 RepID=A0ABV0EBH7_9BURK
MDAALEEALAAVRRGDWHHAHRIAQTREDALACWLHAILHKIEGDTANSRYWYARAGRRYEDFSDPVAELEAFGRVLAQT